MNKVESVAEALSKRFPIAHVWLVILRHWRDADGGWYRYSYCPAGQFNVTVQHSAPSLAHNEQGVEGSLEGCALDEQVAERIGTISDPILVPLVFVLPQKPQVGSSAHDPEYILLPG